MTNKVKSVVITDRITKNAPNRLGGKPFLESLSAYSNVGHGRNLSILIRHKVNTVHLAFVILVTQLTYAVRFQFATAWSSISFEEPFS